MLVVVHVPFCRVSLGGPFKQRKHRVENQRTLQMENVRYPICISHHSIQNEAERPSNSLASQPFPMWMVGITKFPAPRISVREDTKSLARLSTGKGNLGLRHCTFKPNMPARFEGIQNSMQSLEGCCLCNHSWYRWCCGHSVATACPKCSMFHQATGA